VGQYVTRFVLTSVHSPGSTGNSKEAAVEKYKVLVPVYMKICEFTDIHLTDVSPSQIFIPALCIQIRKAFPSTSAKKCLEWEQQALREY
jgi:hypothetical protein